MCLEIRHLFHFSFLNKPEPMGQLLVSATVNGQGYDVMN